MNENEQFEETEVHAEPDLPVTEAPEPVAPDPLEALRNELSELRALIEGQAQARSSETPAVTEEFRSLYPDVQKEEIPDEVWEAARGGLPLEAAYALHERREAVRKQDAERVNRRNTDGAWGRAEAMSEDFLSPDEVRLMTPAEVRKNYARITASMKHWN